MKKQLFFALILLCSGLSLNAMTTDMENQKEEVVAPVAPVLPAPVKEEKKDADKAVAPVKEEEETATPAEEDFEIDMTEVEE